MRISSVALLAALVLGSALPVAPAVAEPVFRLGTGEEVVNALPPDTDTNDDGDDSGGGETDPPDEDPVPPPGSPPIQVATLPPPTFDGYAGVPSTYDIPDVTGGTGTITYTPPNVPGATINNGVLSFTPPTSGSYWIKVQDSVGMKTEIEVWVPPTETHGFSHRGFYLQVACRNGQPGADWSNPIGYATIAEYNLYCGWIVGKYMPSGWRPVDPMANEYTTYWIDFVSGGWGETSTTYGHYKRSPGYTGPIDFTWYE